MTIIKSFINTPNNFKPVIGKDGNEYINRTGWKIVREKYKKSEDSYFYDHRIRLFDPESKEVSVNYGEYMFDVLRSINGFIYQKDQDRQHQSFPFISSVYHFPIGTKVRLCPTVALRKNDNDHTEPKIDVVTIIGHLEGGLCVLDVERDEAGVRMFEEKYQTVHYCHFKEIIELGTGGFNFNFDNHHSLPPEGGKYKIEEEARARYRAEEKEHADSKQCFQESFNTYLREVKNIKLKKGFIYTPGRVSRGYFSNDGIFPSSRFFDFHQSEMGRVNFVLDAVEPLVKSYITNPTENINAGYVLAKYMATNKERISSVITCRVQEIHDGVLNEVEADAPIKVYAFDLNHFKQWLKKNVNKLKAKVKRHTNSDEFHNTCSMNDSMDDSYYDFDDRGRVKESFQISTEQHFFDCGLLDFHVIDQSHNGYVRYKRRDEEQRREALEKFKVNLASIAEQYGITLSIDQERDIVSLYKHNCDWMSYLWINVIKAVK